MDVEVHASNAQSACSASVETHCNTLFIVKLVQNDIISNISIDSHTVNLVKRCWRKYIKLNTPQNSKGLKNSMVFRLWIGVSDSPVTKHIYAAAKCPLINCPVNIWCLLFLHHSIFFTSLLPDLFFISNACGL